MNRLLKHVLVPLIYFIKRWIYYGEVNDPYDEFFIKENKKVPLEHLWRKKYHVNVDLLPKFLDGTLVDNILQTGKSVNFLRKCCDVTD